MNEPAREWRVENIAAFLAFAIDGHDPSWGHVSDEAKERYHYNAEGLLRCAEGEDWETVAVTPPDNESEVERWQRKRKENG